MIRQTSVDAYNAIKENGLLSKLRFQAYSILFTHGPLTANEMIDIARKHHGLSRPRDGLNQRLSELRDCGVIYEVRRRACTITGNEVIEWDVTSNLPQKSAKEEKREPLFILFDISDDSFKIFKTKAKASEYKLKHSIRGLIHQAKLMK